MEKTWWVYMLQCGDNTLYTGMTDNIDRRIAEHQAGKGAKYTRERSPITLVYKEKCENKSQALRRESQIKHLTRREKIALIEVK